MVITCHSENVLKSYRMSHTYESYTMSQTYESYSLSDRDELGDISYGEK